MVAERRSRYACLVPEVAFHRLTAGRGWKSLGELLLVVVVFLVLLLGIRMLIVAASGVPSKDLDHLQGGWGLAFTSIGISSLIAATRIAALATRNDRSGTLSSVAGRLRWRWLGKCVLVALVLYAWLPVSALFDADAHWPGWREFAPLAVLIVAVVPFQAAGEEYAFRGTLLQAIGAWVAAPWVSIVITAVAFAAAHVPNAQGWVAVGSIGVVSAWLAIRTGGLEAAIAMHAVNNVLAFEIEAGSGRAGSWMSNLGSVDSWLGVAIGVAVQLVYAAVIVRVSDRARRDPQQR